MSIRTTTAILMGAATLIAINGPALAQFPPGNGFVYESERRTRGPEHGYSGFVWSGPGPRSVYCDYQRIPNRVCATSRDGRRRCRVEGWTLRQYCY